MNEHKKTFEFSGVSLDLIEIPAGEFEMGSINELPFALETPVHRAVISKGFFVAVFPVTQEQYVAVMKTKPAHFRHAAGLPVENVNWFEAKAFCQNLIAICGRVVRLPTETEWEFVARAGAQTDYFFGENTNDLTQYAWFEDNSHEQTHPVGLKKPNDWGVYDIVGNIWEWCEDTWKSDYNDFPADGSAFVNENQPRRAMRGGAWNMDAFRCRSSYRSFDWNDAAHNRLGFRVIVEI